jgi:putative flippase GtrA
MGSRWSSLHSPSVVAQAGRFAGVGVANTVVYYGSYLLLRLAFSFLVADILAVIVGMLFAFFAHSAITYRTRPTLKKLLLFPLGNIAGYLVLTVGAWGLVRSGLNDRWAPLLAAAVSVPVTFVVLRFILTGPDGRRAESQRGSSS